MATMKKGYKANHILWDHDIDWAKTKENWIEAYLEHCEINDLDVPSRDEVNEDEVFTYALDMNDSYFEDFLSEIHHYEKRNGSKMYVVIGKIQTWRGVFDGGKLITGMEQVLQDCSEDYNTYGFRNNQMFIEATHHDGTHCFLIRELTPAGKAFVERHHWNMSDRELHAKLFKNHKLSHKVSMFMDIYGV